jgi:hypothetical protein
MTLEEFEEPIAGIRNLIEMSRKASHSRQHLVKIINLSSLLVAQSWDPSVRLYPENEILDAEFSEGTGVGESEYVVHMVRI